VLGYLPKNNQQMEAVVKYVENIPIMDVYCDGIAVVESLGVNFRTIYFVYARSPDGILEKVAVSKIIRPMTSLVNKHGGMAALLAQSEPLQLVNRAAH